LIVYLPKHGSLFDQAFTRAPDREDRSPAGLRLSILSVSKQFVTSAEQTCNHCRVAKGKRDCIVERIKKQIVTLIELLVIAIIAILPPSL
jgi:hypothetical protein